MAFGGVGIGFGYVPPYAMLPDAIEVEAARSGKRNEGAYYGIWTLMSKLGTSAATALLGFVLALARYVPDVTQAPRALFAIRLLVGPIPMVFLIGAAVLRITSYNVCYTKLLRAYRVKCKTFCRR